MSAPPSEITSMPATRNRPLTGRAWWLGCLLVFAGAVAATVPTLGDLGLTYDEPAYRYSQMVSQAWWEHLARGQFDEVLSPDALLYYWPYARHGINFHPPLAGQLNLLTYNLFGGVMKDIPARRLGTTLSYCAAIVMLFGFLARRYDAWTGLVAAVALLTMPRVYGQAHLIDTDTLGMVLWLATALAFWKGLYEPGGRPWRVLVGVLLGLAFVEKMGAVFVVIPLMLWLVLARLPATFGKGGRAAWVDGIVTTIALLLPLAVAYAEIRRLTTLLPPPQQADLFLARPESRLPGAILLVPLIVWIVRELVRRVRRGHRVWGVERPALEVWAAILAFAPVVGWLGNPAWWRETLPRLAHYYQISTARRGVLPDIQVIYLGEIYEYALPWHSGWVLLAITVPATLLVAAGVGVLYALRRLGRDRLPLFFLVLMVALPTLRFLPTPAHDGVRLFLPAFAFFAGLVGWGTVWVADGLSWLIRPVRRVCLRALVAATVLLPAAWELVKVHPFELSYYNTWIGGPKGAWDAGFELSYWYDAFTPAVLDDMNERLPRGAAISYANEKSNPVMVLQDLQALGQIRGDLRLWSAGQDDTFPYMWLLTHDSKTSAFTRLLFMLEPWYAVEPGQLDGLRVLSVYDPPTVARAWALQLLTDGPGDPRAPEPSSAPAWVHASAPWLGRFWGDGLETIPPLGTYNETFTWAEDDPEGLRDAARSLADLARDHPARLEDAMRTLAEAHARTRQARSAGDRATARFLNGAIEHLSAQEPFAAHPGVVRLMAILARYDDPASGRLFSRVLLRSHPEAVFEAALVLIARGDAVQRTLLHPGYRNPQVLGGFLDQELPGKANSGAL